MTELWEIGFRWVCWIQARSRVVWREQDQRVQERDQAALVIRLQSGECVTSSESFASVAENDVIQRHAAAVVTVRSSASYTPQGPG